MIVEKRKEGNEEKKEWEGNKKEKRKQEWLG